VVAATERDSRVERERERERRGGGKTRVPATCLEEVTDTHNELTLAE
jgi:hypothetical protein